MTSDGRRAAPSRGEPVLHDRSLAARLNRLRAGVLGANDGIVSVAGLVVGVAGATASSSALLAAGVAGLVAGALSMAAGEYVSVSTQRDTQEAVLAVERRELAELPAEELDELAGLYEGKGLPPALAREVAVALTAHDALRAHADAELGLDPDEVVSAWQAAWTSAGAFTAGALLPLLAVLLAPTAVRLPVCVVAVLAALALTGTVSARLGGAPRLRAALRTTAGGGLAMAVTYLVGRLVGTAL
ncbi:VIT1/CCC1 transporter family protein [Pseudokineococcus lusitanus]|uniref:VIT1/CCC1 family predicted Fe2+/Mn2+ transporter n=1 Tax=Pseudokineococcus lusitanus TaxID=763993 RepID=A0A3N1HJY4_9ACTN|nr:VIT family protein [Pseudokineococcus lusitanus]ROP42833.1 VIT1/CCC1 family predicted Fe2+/Mn2+ transporter [Pseudokineococcus lusitanus]